MAFSCAVETRKCKLPAVQSTQSGPVAITLSIANHKIIQFSSITEFLCFTHFSYNENYDGCDDAYSS